MQGDAERPAELDEEAAEQDDETYDMSSLIKLMVKKLNSNE